MTSRVSHERQVEFKIGVNPDAMFSIFYEDANGRLIFLIEVDENPKNIYLNSRPSTNGRIVDARDEPMKSRVALAIRRVTAYFESKGLTVDLD